jgi:hypothetical protein
METGQLGSLPEIIECSSAYGSRGSWPNISKFTGTVDGFGGGNKKYHPFVEKKYRYTFNNLWNKKVTFCIELNGEFKYFDCFKIVKITTKK